MVKAFGAEVQATNDPSYIGFSREGDANKSMKALFSGVGNLIDQKSKFYEEQQKQEADVAAQEIVNGTVNTPTETPVSGGTGSDNILGTAGTDTVSTEVKSIGSKGAKLTQAYKEGKITASSYWAQMDSMVKAAKARYPAQADRIDQQVSLALGRRPASAAIEEAREEWKSSLAEKNEDEKMFARFVETNAQHLPPDYYKRQNEGRPYSKIETRAYVTELRIEAEMGEKRRLALTEAKQRGDATEEQSVGNALDEANTYVNRTLTSTVDTQSNFSEMLKKAQQKGKDLTPDEQMQLRDGFAQLKFTVQQGIENILSRPWSDGTTTYYNQIKNPEKIKQIRESALSRIDYIEKLINDKDYGLLNADINRTKAMRDEVTRKVLETSDSVRVFEAVKNMGGELLVNEVLLNDDGKYLKSSDAKAIRDITLGRIMSGDAKSLDDEMRKGSAANVPKEERGKLNFGMIREATNILNNDGQYYKAGQTPTQIKLNAARTLFGPDNRHFLSNIKDEQKTLIWSRLASPETTKTMKELAKQDPQVWEDYRSWVKVGFGQTFSKFARDIQEGVTARPNINIGWDSKAKRFMIASTPARTRRPTNIFSASQQGMEEYFTSNIEQSVNEFNKQLNVLVPIMEADGQDVTEELYGFMESLEIDVMAPKEMSVFTKFRKAVIDATEALNPGGSEDAAGKKR